MAAELCNSKQAAAAAGISLMTLQRWIAAKKIGAPRLQIRNGHTVRLWNEEDLARLRKLKRAIYRKGRGRKKKTNT